MTDQKVLSVPAAARVLVVEDEAPVRSALARALSLRGYRVCQAATGRQALQMLARTPCDAMVLDISMPDLDGVHVMRNLHQDGFDKPAVVVLTGHASLESAIEAVKAGASDYLMKPASLYAVIAAVENAIAQRDLVWRRRPSSPAVVNPAAGPQGPAASDPKPVLLPGRLRLDRARDVVEVPRREGQGVRTIRLSPMQMRLLAYLVQQAGVVVDCREIAKGGLGYDLSEKQARIIVRPHISRLRKRIELDPSHPRLLRTVPHKGYVLVP